MLSIQWLVLDTKRDEMNKNTKKLCLIFHVQLLYMFCNTQDMYAKTMHGNLKIFQNICF